MPLTSESVTFESVEAETDRIIRVGSLWTAVGAIAPVLGLGPLLAAGWRPGDLPMLLDLVWWLGAVAAAVGLALLVWAGCPVLGFKLDQAYRQKVPSIRIGIVLNLGGMALAGIAILLSPATG